MQNICNLIGWNSLHVSDIFNCYSANINRMLNAKSLAAYAKYTLVITRFRVQYDQYFPSFSYFADLFHYPLGE